MTNIDQIICSAINPFDGDLKPGNFWQEHQDKALSVDSIHQDAIAQIEEFLDRVAADSRSRTLLLLGDPGSGKSYLLGRMKRVFNPKAFFAYIGPWPSSDRIWQHILRYTVDSLIQVPEGETDSQLILWLKSLPVFRKLSLKEVFFEESIGNLLKSKRQKFIQQFRNAYRNKGIYNAESFFGILHDLTNPELCDLACDWLRGEDLSDESLAVLKVRHPIQTEQAASEILANLGRIASETKPIVLCFDQLDGLPTTANGLIDLQSLFNVNTNVHNQKLENFLVIISITTDTWRQNSKQVHLSDLDRLDTQIRLKQITSQQIEALWSMRLYPLHQQAQPQPTLSLYPLEKEQIKINFPSGKGLPRAALVVGRDLFQQYKKGLIGSNGDPGPDLPDPEEERSSAFALIWQNESKKSQTKVSKISLFSGPELIQRLKEALKALQVEISSDRLLVGKYASYSFSFIHPQSQKSYGIVWTEDPNMTSFYSVMKACQKVSDARQVEILCLIRANDVGRPNLVGNKLYREIFVTGTTRPHLKGNITSVRLLETYHNCLNSAKSSELVVAGKTIAPEELNDLVRQTKVLEECQLLQDLKVFSNSDNKPKSSKANLSPEKETPPVTSEEALKIRTYLLNQIQIQNFMGFNTLVENTLAHHETSDRALIEREIHQLVREQKIKLNNPQESPEKQLVYWIPKSAKSEQ